MSDMSPDREQAAAKDVPSAEPDRTDDEASGISPLFAALFEAAPVAIGLAEVESDGRASIIRMNNAYTALLGFSREELTGRGDDLLHPDDVEAVRGARHALATGELDQDITEVRVLRADGSYIWTRMTRAAVPDETGAARYVLSILEDITEHRVLHEQLVTEANTDPLTGVANRRRLIDFLDASLATSGEKPIAVIVIDLDGFKAINDKWGHQTGDQILIEVAEQLRLAVRPSDLVARVGGDEFVVIAAATSVDESKMIARRIAKSVRVELGQMDRPCHASVGVTLSEPDDSSSVILDRADRGMYRSKAKTRAQSAAGA